MHVFSTPMELPGNTGGAENAESRKEPLFASLRDLCFFAFKTPLMFMLIILDS